MGKQDPIVALKAAIMSSGLNAQAVSALRDLVDMELKTVAPVRTYATKAERAAGNGFSCSCGRTDLRVEPVQGRSFHKDPSGNLHDLR